MSRITPAPVGRFLATKQKALFHYCGIRAFTCIPDFSGHYSLSGEPPITKSFELIDADLEGLVLFTPWEFDCQDSILEYGFGLLEVDFGTNSDRLF